MRQLKYNLRESAILVAKEVSLFWEKAKIPVQMLDKCTDKIEKLYNNWRSIQKNAGKGKNEIRESDFKSDIDLLFDIAASAKVLEGIDDAILAFLKDQRHSKRIGFIGDIQTKYDEYITDDEFQMILNGREEAKYKREQSTLGMIEFFKTEKIFFYPKN